MCIFCCVYDRLCSKTSSAAAVAESIFLCFPGELSKKWQFGPVARISQSHTAKRFALVAFLFVALQSLGASPFLFQRIIVRGVQPWLLAAITMVVAYAISKPLYLALFCVLIAGVILFLYRHHIHDKNAHDNTLLIQPEHDLNHEDNDVDGHGDEANQGPDVAEIGNDGDEYQDDCEDDCEDDYEVDFSVSDEGYEGKESDAFDSETSLKGKLVGESECYSEPHSSRPSSMGRSKKSAACGSALVEESSSLGDVNSAGFVGESH